METTSGVLDRAPGDMQGFLAGSRSDKLEGGESMLARSG